MSKLIVTLLLFVFITNCSLDKKSGIWTEKKNVKEYQKGKIQELFKNEIALENELNPEIKINLSSKPINKSFVNNLSNNNQRINFDGNLKTISRFNFSKIDQFNQFEPEIIFEKNNVIFFENKGAIFKFNDSSKLIWKKNYYSKSEKKLKPVLFFANNNNVLIVADNIAKYYALNINTGELLWTKNHSAPFNSQLKIYQDKFFVIDNKNTLRCFSIKNGSEIWNFKSEEHIIKSPKKLSLVISKDQVFFNNSLGDITSVNIDNGDLLWQVPTLSSLDIESKAFFKTSDLILANQSIFFSNNQNDFFSLDSNTGSLNWQQKINSNLRPTFIEDFVFTVSMNGFLVIIDNSSGNIIRITDIFKNFKKKKRSKIYPVGFIVGSNNIYLTTSNGKLMIIDIATGRTKSILKIDNDKISRPFVLNQSLYIIKENSIIKLN